MYFFMYSFWSILKSQRRNWSKSEGNVCHLFSTKNQNMSLPLSLRNSRNSTPKSLFLRFLLILLDFPKRNTSHCSQSPLFLLSTERKSGAILSVDSKNPFNLTSDFVTYHNHVRHIFINGGQGTPAKWWWHPASKRIRLCVPDPSFSDPTPRSTCFRYANSSAW